MTSLRAACDTSVAVAALDASHTAHAACRAAVIAHRPALAGHAAYETHSVLTRLPLPLRITARQAAAVIADGFPDPCFLGAEDQEVLRRRLGELGLVGGAVYDALVGEAARAHDRTLLTRDRRAVRTYAAIGTRYELVDDRELP